MWMEEVLMCNEGKHYSHDLFSPQLCVASTSWLLPINFDKLRFKMEKETCITYEVKYMHSHHNPSE